MTTESDKRHQARLRAGRAADIQRLVEEQATTAGLDETGQIAGQLPLPATAPATGPTDSEVAQPVTDSAAHHLTAAVAEPAAAPAATRPTARRRRAGQTLSCGWCGRQLALAATGRTRKWCSDSCRRRAWETSHAVATGAIGVRVVDRQVEVEVPVEVPVIEQVEVPTHPKGAEWVEALRALTWQIQGAKPSLYDRDLPAIQAALTDAARALMHRQETTRRR